MKIIAETTDAAAVEAALNLIATEAEAESPPHDEDDDSLWSGLTLYFDAFKWCVYFKELEPGKAHLLLLVPTRFPDVVGIADASRRAVEACGITVPAAAPPTGAEKIVVRVASEAVVSSSNANVPNAAVAAEVNPNAIVAAP